MKQQTLTARRRSYETLFSVVAMPASQQSVTPCYATSSGGSMNNSRKKAFLMVAGREGVQSSLKKRQWWQNKQGCLHQNLGRGSKQAGVFRWPLYIQHKAEKQVDPFLNPLHPLYPFQCSAPQTPCASSFAISSQPCWWWIALITYN